MSLSIVAGEPEEFRARVVVPLPRRPVAAAEAADASRPVVDVVVPVLLVRAELAGLRIHEMT
jgi:hypothetical protein